MSGNPRFRLWLAVLLVLSIVLLVSHRPKHPATQTKLPGHQNQLALGSRSDVTGPMEIPINPAVEFDFKNKSEILKLPASLDVFLWEKPPKALRRPPVMTLKLKFI